MIKKNSSTLQMYKPKSNQKLAVFVSEFIKMCCNFLSLVILLQFLIQFQFNALTIKVIFDVDW